MEKDQEKLIIQSDQEWIGYLIGKIFSIVIIVVLICVMLIYFVLTDIMRTKQDVQKLIFMLTILVLLVLSNIYRYWRNIGRVLILDKTGVLAKMWFYKKKYKWSDLKIKQLRKNLGKYYEEGVFLAAYDYQPKQDSNCEFFNIRYPFESFNINFKMHKPILVETNWTKYINGEMMAVEKEELLSKLKEWGVDFETERPKNFDIFQDKKGRLQSRRNGTAWILLAAAVWLLLLGFIIYPIFIWKNLVLIAIFIPFFIALVPVYVVVTSRKSYRLKMDEKGCIRTFLFLSKRYLWKDLRVKLVASEESHCGEGVLFIKKKSGNSSSASETFSYASLHPYSSFVANFEVFGKMYGEKDALHEINKELFLEKMKEWGVEVEGLPKEE